MNQSIAWVEVFERSNPEKVKAFSSRAALRLLPLLQSSMKVKKRFEPFHYWPKNKRSKNLLNVFKAAFSTIAYLNQQEKIDLNDTIVTTEIAARGIVHGSVGPGIIKASYACSSVVASLLVTNGLEEYTNAALYCVFPWASQDERSFNFVDKSIDSEHYRNEISRDLDDLLDVSVSVNQFLNKPLWRTAPPQPWRSQLEIFKFSLLKMGRGFEMWLNWYGELIEGKFNSTDQVEWVINAPPEILAQDAEALSSYINAIKNNSAIRPLNRVRAIFIGYGEAGKTSLIRVLHNETVLQGKEPMTPGIEIREWGVPNTDIVAHFWDFGGQVMVHATHQLFLRSSCLYVLVISARSEINASEQAEYWLEHIKSFGGNASVLIVGNRIDQSDLNLDLGFLCSKYPNIVGYYPLSCTLADGEYRPYVEKFKSALCRELIAITTHQMMFTEAQFQLLSSLQSLSSKKSFIAKSDFDELCREHKIKIAGSQGRAWMLDILDKLGIIIHFAELPFVDGYVLNPRWLTYGIYTLMYAKKPQLTESDVVDLLGKKKVIDEFGNELHYPIEKSRLILDAMHQFKLSYPLANSGGAVIIPSLLQASQPNFNFDKSGSIEFEFAFDVFLPRHVLPELIVNRYQEIFQQNVWQTGVNLRHATLQAEALLLVDYHARRLIIWVLGKDSRDYLTLLRDEVEGILERISVNYKELVTLPTSARIGAESFLSGKPEKAAYKQLLACVVRGSKEFIAESGDEYDVGKVLLHFISEKKQENDLGNRFGSNLIINMENKMGNKTTILNNSTVNGDIISADNIANSFNKLTESKMADDLRVLLERLLNDVNELKKNSYQAIASDVNDIVADTAALIDESSLDTPNPSRLTRKLGGILAAAKTVGEVGKTVVETVALLAPLIGISN